MTKILFVCHGNICRSPMAEYIFKKLAADQGIERQFEVASCATSREEIGNEMYPPAKDILRRHDIPYGHHSARQITAEDLDYFDYIITMDQNNLRNLSRMFPNADDAKIHPLMSFAGSSADVSDPWYSRDFERAYQDILTGCEGLLTELSK